MIESLGWKGPWRAPTSDGVKTECRSGCSGPYWLHQRRRFLAQSISMLSYPHSGNPFLISRWHLSQFGLCPLCLTYIPLCRVWPHLLDACGNWELLVSPTEANPDPSWTSPGPSASLYRPSAPAPAITAGLCGTRCSLSASLLSRGPKTGCKNPDVV